MPVVSIACYRQGHPCWTGLRRKQTERFLLIDRTLESIGLSMPFADEKPALLTPDSSRESVDMGVDTYQEDPIGHLAPQQYLAITVVSCSAAV